MTKILALVLAFFLGFLSCIGTIFGVGYYAYSTITYDKLKDWNIVPDESRYIEEDPEKDLTAMSLKAFFAELKELQTYGDDFTLNLMINRWGLKIPNGILKMIPEGVLKVPVKELFSSGGINTILENTPVSFLFVFLEKDENNDNPGASEPQFVLAKEALEGKTLKDVLTEDLADMLVGLKLGYVLGLEYQKENGEYVKNSFGHYVVKYENPESPELIELMGGLDVGLMLKAFNGNGNLFEVVEDGLNDVMVEHLVSSMTQGDNSTVSNLFGGKTVGDLLEKDEETGEYSFAVREVLSGRRIGELLGYSPVYLYNDEESGIIIDWVDKDGARLTGAFRGIAEGTLKGFDEKEVDTDELADGVLENAYLGFFMGYDPVYAYNAEEKTIEIVGWKDGGDEYYAVYDAAGNIVGWQDEDGNVPPAGWEPDELDRVSETLANQKATVFMDDGFSVDSLMKGLYIGDLMEYTPVFAEDGKTVVGWKDKDGKDLDKVSEALAKQEITAMTGGDFTIDKVLKGLYVGDLLKYTSETNEKGELVWKDADGKDLDKVTRALAGKYVTDLTKGNFEVADVLEGLHVGDLMKYTQMEDNPENWLDRDGKEVTGIDRATANIDLRRMIKDDTYNVSDAFNDVYMGEAMKYYHDAVPLVNSDPTDTTVRYQWYKKKDAATGILSEPTEGIEQKLSNYSLGDLMNGKVTSDEITKGMPLHEVLNLHAVEIQLYNATGTEALVYATGARAGQTATIKIWYDKNNVRASDTISALAECTIDKISSQVNDVKVGWVTGLTEFEGVWYKAEFKTSDFDGDGEAETRYCLSNASGILVSLGDLSIGELSDNNKVTEKVKTVKIGDAMGYTFFEGKWYTDAGHVTPVTGMMKALSPKTVGEMDTISTTMPIGELLGYEKVGGIWYKDYANNVRLEPGTMLAIADFNIDGENGLESKIGTVFIGQVIGYTQVGAVWYTSYTDAENNTPVAGIMKPFAGLTIDEMKDTNKVTAAVQDVYIGDAMGYTLFEDKWYKDAEHLTPVTGMMKALAPKKVSEMDDVSSTVPVGELLGYEKHGNVWYSAYTDDGIDNDIEVTGVVGSICDSYVDTLSNDIENTELGKAISLYRCDDPTDVEKYGKWYKDRAFTVEAAGVMATFADLRIKDLQDETLVSQKSVNVVIGYAMGYTYFGGVWYKDSEHLYPVDGIMKSLAPKKVGELNDLTHTMTVGEMMGYEKSGGVWYTDTTYSTPASSAIQAVADSTIENLDHDLNDTQIGKIIGYTYNEGESWWYNGSEKASTIVNTIAGTKLGQLGTRLSSLKVSDMFSDSERETGFPALLPPNALLSELSGSGPNSLSTIFKTTTMGNYVSKGLIQFENTAKLTAIDPDWESRTIQQFINHMIESFPTP